MKELSDFELNKAIAEKLKLNIGERQYMKPTVGINNYKDRVDYCNNWNDLMPLVVEHKIEYLLQDGGSYLADAYADDLDCFTVTGENLQMALAECLLKVLESKSES